MWTTTMARLRISNLRWALLRVAMMSFGVLFAAGLAAAPVVGEPAPGFSVLDTAGATWTLGDLRGKSVVLEWTNHDCPYVRKHYSTGNMQALQREAVGEGYIWLSVISSAPGKQGYLSPEEAAELTVTRNALPTAVLLDKKGEVGRAYQARTTPHMYVIGPDGVLLYMGGIDDRPTSNPADVAGADNYVRAAMSDIAAGKDVARPVTRPYGCSVKY